MTLEGTVINGQIVLKDPQLLPEGAKVHVMVQTPPVRLPDDEWVRILKEIPIDCGVSLSNEALGREEMYD